MVELFEKLRVAPLENTLHGEEIFVFEHARFSLRDMWPDEVNPSTFYLLADVLERQRDIRQYLLQHYGIDTLHLNDCLELEDERGARFIMTPPFVEIVEELVSYVERGDMIAYPERHVRLRVPLLQDGAHRMWMAMNDPPPLAKVRVVHITRSASWEHPTYAYPNSWKDVKVYDRIQDVPKKKLYRRDPPHTYLRAFMRVLGPSPTGPGSRDAKS